MTQVSLAARALRAVATMGVCFSFLGTPASVPAADSAKWWKGNLHTHTLWSDGDDYPDMVVDWYKTKGYHFLGLSDHNTIQLGERWIDAKKSKGGVKALEKYRAKFGDKWVESRMTNGVEMVRLKTLGVMQPHFNEAGRFLLIQSEEVTSQYKTWPVHINATNPREILKPQSGDSVLEVIQKTFDNFAEHRKKTGEPMFMHLNHPNFRWGVTAEDILPVKGDRFFEVYNGHPTVYNEGDATHASTDRIWDILLSFRLAELNLHVMYGVGTDDSHNYHEFAPAKSNSGRGWVMVRAKELTIAALVKAMEEGDFYASSGVTLTDVKREKNRIAVEIQPEPGVTYTTQFIGTRKGFDRSHEPLRTPGGEMLRVTHRYSKDVGAVLAEVKGTSASYTLKGDEIYVRAKVISSKPKAGSPTKDEVECAWVQPVVSGVK